MIKMMRGGILAIVFFLLLELIIVVLWPQTLTMVADLVVKIRSLLAQ